LLSCNSRVKGALTQDASLDIVPETLPGAPPSGGAARSCLCAAGTEMGAPRVRGQSAGFWFCHRVHAASRSAGFHALRARNPLFCRAGPGPPNPGGDGFTQLTPSERRANHPAVRTALRKGSQHASTPEGPRIRRKNVLKPTLNTQRESPDPPRKCATSRRQTSGRPHHHSPLRFTHKG